MIRLPVYHRVLDYIVKRSDFSGQPAREKHAQHNLQVLILSRPIKRTIWM